MSQLSIRGKYVATCITVWGLYHRATEDFIGKLRISLGSSCNSTSEIKASVVNVSTKQEMAMAFLEL